jgi:phosphotransacetylase
MHTPERGNFQRLVAAVQAIPPAPTAVAHPCNEASLTGAVEAASAGIITPILVGPRRKILASAEQAGLDISPYEIVDAEHSHQSAELAVALVREGRAETLMKGSLGTDELLGPVVKRDTGLRTERRLTHCFIMDVPGHANILFITDAAINIVPTLEEKVDIVQNAIDLARCLGIEIPKVAILSAMEKVNPKLQSTVEAAALCKMADRGQITGGLLDGPLALDNAISPKAARIKGIGGAVAGHADILVVPDLEAGNVLAKSLSFLMSADSAGIVLGARVPITLTSRADSLQSRLASAAVAALVAHRRKEAAAIEGVACP